MIHLSPYCTAHPPDCGAIAGGLIGHARVRLRSCTPLGFEFEAATREID